MIYDFFGLRFDLPEFFVGLAVGLIGAWFLRLAIPRVKLDTRWVKELLLKARQALSAGAEEPYRLELLQRAETLHLASPIFSLREILVEPRILAMPPPTDPLQTEPILDHTLAVLPTLPDDNPLSAIYPSPSLSPDDILAESGNLLITGEPGSGKTTALACLALRSLQPHIEQVKTRSRLPVFVHAAEIIYTSAKSRDPLQRLIGAAGRSASGRLEGLLPRYLRLVFQQRRALLLLDGLDELSTAEFQILVAWLRNVQRAYPGNRTIAAGPATGYDGLLRLGFAPHPLAPWSHADRIAFLDRWGRSWQELVAPTLPRDRFGKIDPSLLSGWLKGALEGDTPLEATLRLWAAYSGDVRGARVTDSLEAYIARLISPDERPRALAVAWAWMRAQQSAIPERALERRLGVADLVAAGILVRRPGGRVGFANPSIGAYLGGHRLAEDEAARARPWESWPPSRLALKYFAALGDASSVAKRLLDTPKDALSLGTFVCASWLRIAEEAAPWREQVLAVLGRLLINESLPSGKRLRAVHAFVSARETSAAILFRKLLASPLHVDRILGSLGLGGLRIEDAVPALLERVAQDEDLHVRFAACQALSAIGSESALLGLGRALLEGGEMVQIAAAEALAGNAEEGYAMLRDAVQVSDLRARRAAVFGLAKVAEPWAIELLDKIQLDDPQWVVKNAAADAAERRRARPWKIVAHVTEVSDLPWLLAFAARDGVGVAPGQGALETLRRALGKGTAEEQVAAIETVAWVGAQDLLLELHQFLGSAERHLRDAAFEALWRLAAEGVSLPAAEPSVPTDGIRRAAPGRAADDKAVAEGKVV